jgi:branched-subunit amino acid aminotransferase/4-amino-4-deoxychorismate lyase
MTILRREHSNLFLVNQDGELVTPPVEAGLLPGITRSFVQKLALKLGIKSSEEHISLKKLDDFCEAFITNSLMEIMPVASITDAQGIEYIFKRGNITDALIHAYRECVIKEVEQG